MKIVHVCVCVSVYRIFMYIHDTNANIIYTSEHGAPGPCFAAPAGEVAGIF